MNLFVKDKKGIVVLVGAGPGDEGLITVKGKTWLERADVVVYDHLANRNLNQYARQDAEIIYAGKKSGQATLTQDEINSLLVEKALEGKTVVRLKGGDPFIFGRGGEEVQFLKEADIPFAIVPGVTSAIGVSAYAGIPLTHRDFASSLSIITGSLGGNKKENEIEWDKIATYAGTLIFLMGARKLDLIVAQLIKHGKSPDTPIAVIQSGTTPQQKTWTGTLNTIEKVINKDVVRPPALTIIGEVVKLKKTADWFEQLPLFGKTVALTRPIEQSKSLINLLQEKGATPIIFPVVQDCPPDDWEQLDQALLNLSDYEGVFFSSGKGVEYFLNRLKEKNLDIRELKGLEIFAHGNKANQAVEALGIRVAPISNPLDAETLKKSMGKEKLSGCRYLFPRATKAPQHLPVLLMDLGAVVDTIPVYQSLPHSPKNTDFFESFGLGEIDVITFTSAETVNNFYKLTPKNLLPRLEKSNIACIGPATANAAKLLGLKVRIMPEQCTIERLVETMVLHYS
jgi:uroporphyrinogen III methyltransferase / synthase